jgi:hypothetical protein
MQAVQPLASSYTDREIQAHLGRWRLSFYYCGVFTPCKNCNIETRSRGYATVDEAVFSPWRAEPRSAVQ